MTPEFFQAVANMRDLQKQYREANQKKMFHSAKQICGLMIAAQAKVDRMIAETTEQAPKNQMQLFQ